MRKFFTTLLAIAGLNLVRAINTAAPQKVISAINEYLDGDGDWFRLAPKGEHPNEVGVQLVDEASAAAMVLAFNSPVGRVAHPRGLPIYVGHPRDTEWRRRNPEISAKYPHPIGRITAMEVRDGEAWYKPAINAAYIDLIKGDGAVFAQQSPEWGMAPVPGRHKVYRPVVMYGIGLTNQPQISGTTLGLNETEENQQQGEEDMPTWLLQALGFAAGETPTDAEVQARCTGALNERTTAQAEVAGLRAELVTATGNLTTATNERSAEVAARNAERTARAELVVTSAINEGRIVEADRATWVTSLVGASDFAAETSKLGTLKKAINTESQVQGLGHRKAEATDVVQVTAINEAVRVFALEQGLDVTTAGGHHAAFVGAKAKNPALFEKKSA